MDTKKFLHQVFRRIIEQGISNSKLRDDCIGLFKKNNVRLILKNKKEEKDENKTYKR